MFLNHGNSDLRQSLTHQLIIIGCENQLRLTLENRVERRVLIDFQLVVPGIGHLYVSVSVDDVDVVDFYDAAKFLKVFLCNALIFRMVENAPDYLRTCQILFVEPGLEFLHGFLVFIQNLYDIVHLGFAESEHVRIGDKGCEIGTEEKDNCQGNNTCDLQSVGKESVPAGLLLISVIHIDDGINRNKGGNQTQKSLGYYHSSVD